MTARGEGIINANGREVVLLFNNRALANAEKELGKGIVEVIGSFQSGGSVGDIAILLRHGMEAARRDQRVGGRPVSMVDAYAVMDEAGFTAVAASIMEAVAAVLSYGGGAIEDDGGSEVEETQDPND